MEQEMQAALAQARAFLQDVGHLAAQIRRYCAECGEDRDVTRLEQVGRALAADVALVEQGVTRLEQVGRALAADVALVEQGVARLAQDLTKDSGQPLSSTRRGFALGRDCSGGAGGQAADAPRRPR